MNRSTSSRITSFGGIVFYGRTYVVKASFWLLNSDCDGRFCVARRALRIWSRKLIVYQHTLCTITPGKRSNQYTKQFELLSAANLFQQNFFALQLIIATRPKMKYLVPFVVFLIFIQKGMLNFFHWLGRPLKPALVWYGKDYDIREFKQGFFCEISARPWCVAPTTL